MNHGLIHCYAVMTAIKTLDRMQLRRIQLIDMLVDWLLFGGCPVWYPGAVYICRA